MEEFFNKLGKEIIDTGKDVLEKSKELGNTAKLHAAIMNEERKIKEQYKRIGEAYYKLHHEDYEDEFTVMVSKINQAKEKVKEYQKELAKQKEVKEEEKEVVKAAPSETQGEDEDIIDFEFVKESKETKEDLDNDFSDEE